MNFGGHQWGISEELAALTLEQIDDLRQMYIATHGGKPRKKPLAFPRPWRRPEDAAPKRKATLADVARAFGFQLPPVGKRKKKE